MKNIIAVVFGVFLALAVILICDRFIFNLVLSSGLPDWLKWVILR